MSLVCEKDQQIQNLKSIRHGFFTRLGGVSSGVFSSLNCSEKVEDDPKNVALNRLKIKKYLCDFSTEIFVPKISHGNKVIEIKKNHNAVEIAEIEADALITQEKNIILAVTYADCLPLLLADEDQVSIAAIHCGWRGVRAEVIARCVEKLNQIRGKKTYFAAIGPCISQQGFLVTNEALDYFASAHPEFVQQLGKAGKVDLFGIAKKQLENLGITKVNKIGGFTDQDPKKYFSHRAQNGKTGRHMAAIAMI